MPQTANQPTLRDLLRERGLTFDAAAVLAEVNTSTISRIVNGQIRPGPEVIVRMARALGISARRMQAIMAASASDDRR